MFMPYRVYISKYMIYSDTLKLRVYGDSNPSYRLRRPVGYPDYLIDPNINVDGHIKYKIVRFSTIYSIVRQQRIVKLVVAKS